VNEELPQRTKSIEGLNSLSIPENEEIEMRNGFDPYDSLKEIATSNRRRRSRSVCSADDLKKKSISRTPSVTSSILSSKHKRNASNVSKKVNFDDISLVLFICQHGDLDDDTNLTILRKALEDKTMLSKLETGHQNLSPFHLACAYNQVDVVEFLLRECSIEVNNVDKEGWTPLHSACVEGHIEIVNLLGRCQGRLGSEKLKNTNSEWFYVVDGPIILNPLNDDGETPEMLAIDKKFDQIVQCMQGNLSLFNLMQELIHKYPPTPFHQQVFEQVSDESANETNSDIEPDDGFNSISLSRTLGPLKRHKSTSAPKGSQDRRKGVTTKHDLHSLSSSSNEDMLSTTESDKAPKLIPLNDMKQILQQKNPDIIQSTNSKLEAIKQMNSKAPDTHKLSEKDSKAKRLSASRESLKIIEKKVQSLSISSREPSSERLFDKKGSIIAIDSKLVTNKSEDLKLEKDLKAETNLQLFMTKVDKLKPKVDIANSNSVISKRSYSITRDMEIPTMSGKYTSTTVESKLSMSSIADTKDTAQSKFTVKLPPSRIRAATLSPTRQSSFVSQADRASTPPSIFNVIPPKAVVKSEMPLVIPEPLKKEVPVSSKVIKASTSNIELKPVMPSSQFTKPFDKAHSFDSKVTLQSRIPTPVQSNSPGMNTLKALSKSNVSDTSIPTPQKNSDSQTKNDIVKPIPPTADTPAGNMSMMDRIRMYEKQTKK